MANTIAKDNGQKLSLVDSVARKLLLKMLTALPRGALVIREIPKQKTLTFGDGTEAAVIEVKDGRFYRKVLSAGSIGAAEAYIDGQWDSPNNTAVVQLFARNQELLDTIEKVFGRISGPVNRLRYGLTRNSKAGSKRNIMAHYDLGNAMYEQFLDRSMLYSSALYPCAEASLAEAQQYKMKTICERLDLKPGQSLLEIGTGWGALAIYAAKHYDVQVTTTTISDAQYAYAKARVEAEGLQDKVTLLTEDYRNLSGQYDRLMSIEMIEAVGHDYLPGFFAKLNGLLKPEGRMLLQAITIADQRYDSYRKGVDFIQKYIFPGGCLPSVSVMTKLLCKHSDMVLWSLDDMGQHYARTLRHWHENFDASLDKIHELGYDEGFIRMWKFYLSYCEGAFLERATSAVHLVAVKPDYRC